MDWTAMPFFLAVAREGSLRAAAQRLGATHATVDRHVKSLERDYGVRLFDRTSAGMPLTLAGESLLPMAEAAEDAMHGARARVLGLDQAAQGSVVVSVPPLLAYDVLAPMFLMFSESYPDIDLSIRVTDRFEDLTRLEADVSIRIAPEVTDDVVGRKLVPSAMGLFCSRQYLAEKVRHAGPEGEGLDWVSWTNPEKVRKWAVKRGLGRAGARHVAPDVLMQKAMIKAGFGFGYLPIWTPTYEPDLVRMPDTPLLSNRWIWLLMHGELRKTARVRAFVDFMASEIKSKRAIFEGLEQQAR